MKQSELRRFSCLAISILLPALVLWWLSVDVIVNALRPDVAWLAHHVMPVDWIEANPSHGWLVITNLSMVDQDHTQAAFSVDRSYLRRLALPWPLFLTLFFSSPRSPQMIRRLMIGCLFLIIIFVIFSTIEIFCGLVALSNRTRELGNNLEPAVFFNASPYEKVTFFCARLMSDVAIFYLPLLVPPVLCLTTNPTARLLFLGFGARTEAKSSEASSGTCDKHTIAVPAARPEPSATGYVAHNVLGTRRTSADRSTAPDWQ